MANHAKLGPSAFERWSVCPGSVVLSEGMPNKSSEFSAEGTAAHALGEACLLDGLPTAAFVGLPFEYDDHGETKTIVVQPEMADAVQVYVDHVNELAVGDAVSHVEVKVKVTDETWGTADSVVWQPADKHLFVSDYKHGAGVAVEVVGNGQLKIYALATLLTFGYPAERVTATIVQPRCPHSDGPVRSATYDVVDLLDFHADVLDAIGRVRDAKDRHSVMGDGGFAMDYLRPSEKGCRWCLAATKCPALKSKAQTLAKQVFAPGLPYDPKALADTLDFLPILEAWCGNVREFAYAEAERGNPIPNYKLVEKRATRKWRDEGEAAATIDGLGLGIECYAAPKVLTPAAIEKLLPKEHRGLLDELTVKESSGHALTHASDKRPAIRVDAKSAFSSM